MPRIARVVVPGVPHHVTQRGNRRQRVFFNDDDYRFYRKLLGENCRCHGVAIWAYCLMPNHVHLVMVPNQADGLHLSLARAHLRYTRQINYREGWRGYLWQGRFASFPMDEPHMLAAIRYIELNPVRAGLCSTPDEWPWSSARTHLKHSDDDFLDTAPVYARVDNWFNYLAGQSDANEEELIRRHTRSGRPLGTEDFIAKLEAATGRQLKKRKPGRPSKHSNRKKIT